MSKRSKRKWEPICSWCREDMPEDDGWRTPMFSSEGDYAQGFLAGIVVCDPDCPKRPDDAKVYQKGDL